MPERKYSLKQIAEYFVVSTYEIEQMVRRNELEKEMPRQNTSQKRYWTQSQIARCEEALRVKSLPLPSVSPYKFTKKTQAARAAYWAGISK